MRSLLPIPAADLDLEDLLAAYAYPGTEVLKRPWLRANMVATADGAVTGSDSRSGSISTSADTRVFGILRGLADLVLVGAQTARVEQYGPARARPEFAALRAKAGQPPAPRIALVSNRLLLDPAWPLFTEAAERTIVFTSQASPSDARRRLAEVAEVRVVGDDQVDMPRLIAGLAEVGALRVLCEGGPTLLGELTAAGLLDELCLTLSPLLAGGQAERILMGPSTHRPLTLTHLLEEDGSLFCRWSVRSA